MKAASAPSGADIRALYDNLLAPVARRVDAGLTAQRSDVPAELREMYTYAVSGGMRFRPCLMYLAYLACSSNGGSDGRSESSLGLENLVELALAVELLHKASLVHDDLIDQDPLRRGRPSFHAVFGCERAVIMGDLLVAMAHGAMARMRSILPSDMYVEIQSRLNKAHLDLCCGELLELAFASSPPAPEQASEHFSVATATCDHVERVIYGKTASLIEQSLAMGAIMAGAPASHIEALADYGRHMGFVFQTVNDINNLTGFDRLVKGQAMTDLVLGRVGYPVMGLVRAMGPERLRSLASGADAGSGCSRDVLCELAEAEPFRDWLDGVVREYADCARQALQALPESGARDALDSIGREMFETWFWSPETRVGEVGGMEP